MGGADVQLHSFVTLALDEGERSALRPGHSTPGKEPWIPRTRKLDGVQRRCERLADEEDLMRLEIQPQTLSPYRLTHPISRIRRAMDIHGHISMSQYWAGQTEESCNSVMTRIKMRV